MGRTEIAVGNSHCTMPKQRGLNNIFQANSNTEMIVSQWDY